MALLKQGREPHKSAIAASAWEKMLPLHHPWQSHSHAHRPVEFALELTMNHDPLAFQIFNGAGRGTSAVYGKTSSK